VRQAALSAPAKPEIYYAVAQNFAQIRRHGSTLVVRSTGPPEALARALRAAVHEAIPGQAVFRIATMQRVIESLAKPLSFIKSLFSPRCRAEIREVRATTTRLGPCVGIHLEFGPITTPARE